MFTHVYLLCRGYWEGMYADKQGLFWYQNMSNIPAVRTANVVFEVCTLCRGRYWSACLLKGRENMNGEAEQALHWCASQYLNHPNLQPKTTTPGTYYVFNHVEIEIKYHSGDGEDWEGARLLSAKVTPQRLVQCHTESCLFSVSCEYTSVPHWSCTCDMTVPFTL